MSAETYVLGSYTAVQRLVSHLARLQFAPGWHWKVTLEKVDPRGSDAQRAKIRAIVGDMAEQTGEEAEALYEKLLARRFGVDELDLGNGRAINRPAKRVSDMGRQERSDYIDWLQALASEYGIRLLR